MVSEARSIFVVEDDPTVSEVVLRYLENEGFAVRCFSDGTSALEALAELLPDLLVLDIMLPGIDGLEVCRRAREVGDVPVIMLTALGEESDRLAGLETGADDYITKPFSPRELVARVRAVLRRTAPPEHPTTGVIEKGDLRIDLDARVVEVSGRPISLTVREFDLLAFLAARERQVFTREELLDKVWGYTFGDRSTVTVHVRRLREKIEEDPARPRRIVTVWGVGYRLDP